MAKICLQPLAFEEILRAVHETRTVECSGSLFGINRNLFWVVESAHPLQLVQRFPNSCDPEDGSSRAYWSLFNSHIGGYHSHIPSRVQKCGERFMEHGRVYIGEIDKERFEHENHIEIVVATKRVNEARKLKNENPYIVSGYIEDERTIYKFDIGGYYKNSRIRRAEIEVPRKLLRMLS